MKKHLKGAQEKNIKGIGLGFGLKVGKMIKAPPSVTFTESGA